MNQVIIRSSRATLARCSRGTTVLTARAGSVQNVQSGSLSSIYFSRRYNSGEAGKDPFKGESSPFNVGPANSESSPFNVSGFGDVGNSVASKETASLDLSSLADGNAIDGITAVAVEAAPKLNFFVEQIMSGVDLIHTFSGLPYWGAICVATVAIRLAMLPLSIKTIKSTSKMAHMKPDMEDLARRQKSDPNLQDPNVQAAYSKEMIGMYKKHGVNPLSAIALPFVQMPVFIGIFWALHDMGLYYPGMATGGAFWFTDLSVADSTYALPLFNAASFLLMIEMGADGMQAGQAKQFQWIMRGLAVAMVPLTMSMPQGLFVYWCSNNVLSLIQTSILKNKSVKRFLNIPEPPVVVATPADLVKDPVTQLTQALEKERAMKNSAKADILQGSVPPPPPAAPASFTMPSRDDRKPPSENK